MNGASEISCRCRNKLGEERQNFPYWSTICDYDEEGNKEKDEKDTPLKP